MHGQCCSGGVPISGYLGISASDEGYLQFLLTYDYNNMHDLFEENHQLNDYTRERITHSSLLEVNYGLTDRITLAGMTSFIRQERKVNSLNNQSNFTNTQGPGDGIILIKYRIFSPSVKSDYSFLIGAGPKIPLGRTNFNNENGLALPADLQPGSGAWDLIIWSFFERYHLYWNNLNLATALSYRYTGTNNTYFDVQKYRFGNEFTFNIQTSYRFFMKSLMLDGMVSFLYRNQKQDLVDGETFPNSGGDFIYIIPGLSYNINPNISFQLSGYLPLYRNTRGTQLTTSYKLRTSVSYKIRNKNNGITIHDM